jgi:hypothetical protein
MNIEDRLRALAPDYAGDWSDVRSRAEGVGRSRSRRRLVVAFAALALVVAGTAVGARVLDLFSFSEDAREVPLPAADVGWIAGDVLNIPGSPPQRLSRPLLAPLLGWEPALAIASPDGARLVYHAWAGSVPMLVERDLRTGAERVLARGAQTFAWADDGRRAWFQADHEQYRQEGGDPFVGHVVVDGVRWTRAKGPYEVRAWAQDRLLVHVRRCLICRETLEPGMYALDGPGPLVRLPLDELAALSPDGRRGVGTYLPVAGQDSASGLVRLVDVQRGVVLHTFDLSRLAGERPVNGRGAWRGDEVVLPVGRGFTRELVFLRARARLVRTASVVVPRATLPVRFAVSLHAPAFVGTGTRRVVVGISGERIGGGYASAVLTCDRGARRCVRGRLVPPRRWFAVVENPSRPLP